MKANATIFDTDDLVEPGYGGQVAATTATGSGLLNISGKFLPHSQRRLFKCVRSAAPGVVSLWEDTSGNKFWFSDLVDTVIINMGDKK